MISEYISSLSIPQCGVKVNGEYLEEIIAGYRTSSISGRDDLAIDLDELDIGYTDGSAYRKKRIPAREITVAFHISTDELSVLRKLLNKLKQKLMGENQTFIFQDEPEVYYVGNVNNIVVGEVNTAGSDAVAVAGTFVVRCSDPFKYAVTEKAVSPSMDNGMTFVVDYRGSYKCFPTISAKARGDLGYIGYVDDDGHILQLGDVEEVDSEQYEASQTLVNDSAQTIVDGWKLNQACTVKRSAEHKQVGSAKYGTDANGKGVVVGKDYGSGGNWHGPSLTKVLPADSNGKVGSKNCTLSWDHIYTTATLNDMGNVQFLMTGYNADGSKRNIAAAAYFRNSQGNNNASIDLYVNGSVKNTITFDCSWDNVVTGYNAGRSSIEKFGSKFTFRIQDKVFECDISEMADVEVREISIYIASWDTYPSIGLNGVRSMKFVSHSVDAWKDIPNKFSADDVIEADCRKGLVTVNGVVTPGIGKPGNDWEKFYLSHGTNQIRCAYSSWASQPEFTLKYREVYV